MKPASPRVVSKKSPSLVRQKAPGPPRSEDSSVPGARPLGTLARRVSFEVLRRVEQGDAWASEALNAELRKHLLQTAGDHTHLDDDRRLAQEISLGVLRWRGWLDAEISRLAHRPMSQIDPAARVALRMGLYQIAFLSRIPESAAVNESVNLVKQVKESAHTSGFVNAVLREAVRSPQSAVRSPQSAIEVGKPWEELEAVLSHPAWLLRHWARQWSAERAVQIAQVNNTVPPMYLWLNPLRGDITVTRHQLEAAGAVLKEMFGQPATLEWVDGNLGVLWPLVESGAVYVQDAASQQVARWLEVEPGMQVLDVCAAPGGKTAQLAAHMANLGSITALDLHPQRVAELKENCARLGATMVRGTVADATQDSLFAKDGHVPGRKKFHPSSFILHPSSFDAVLVDAPCSGTGTLRRHPEIKWRLEPKKLAECAGVQSRLLWNAAQAVKPGGVLLYSTCSLEEKEGEEVVRIFRNRHPNFEIAPPATAGGALTDEGFMRTWPDSGPDGFFAARLRRKD